jgi:hypothetical protein
VDQGLAQLAAGEFIEIEGDDEIDAFFDDVLARAARRNGNSMSDK